jgi:hypothetical protein
LKKGWHQKKHKRTTKSKSFTAGRAKPYQVKEIEKIERRQAQDRKMIKMSKELDVTRRVDAQFLEYSGRADLTEAFDIGLGLGMEWQKAKSKRK